jgi:hypothetical protein
MDDALYSRSDTVVKQTIGASEETRPYDDEDGIKNLDSSESVEKQ